MAALDCKMVAHYAWKLKYTGRQDIAKVTTAAELEEHLRVLQLPGIAPAEFVTVEVEASHRGTYTHNDDGSTQWSLIWTQLDGL